MEFCSELLNGCLKCSKGPKTLSLFTSYLSSVTSLEVLASPLVVTCRIPKRKCKKIPKPPRHPYLLKLLKVTETPGWGGEDVGEVLFPVVYHYFKHRTVTRTLKWEARIV